MRDTSRGLLGLILIGLAVNTARPDELTTSAGKKMTGTLVSVDPQGVTFKVGDALQRFPAKEVSLVELAPPPAPPGADAKFTEIELTDGSVLRCTKAVLKGKQFEVELLPGPAGVAPPAFDLPAVSVYTVLRFAEDEKHRERWRQLLLSRGKRDLYVQRQEDGFSVIQGTLIEGTADGDKFVFEQEDGTKSTLRQRSATGGLVLYHPQAVNIAAVQCKVIDAFGNVWIAREIEAAGNGLKVTTAAGATITFPARNGISRLDYSTGNVSYLSDLVPQVTAPAPDEDRLQIPVLKDKGLADAPLTLDGQIYGKGLWVRAPYDEVVLTFALRNDPREFRAVVGCPDGITAAGQNASIKLVIEADGRTLVTEDLKLGEKPRPLALDVKGAKTLRLTVRPSTPYQCTQLILGDARVIK